MISTKTSILIGETKTLEKSEFLDYYTQTNNKKTKLIFDQGVDAVGKLFTVHKHMACWPLKEFSNIDDIVYNTIEIGLKPGDCVMSLGKKYIDINGSVISCDDFDINNKDSIFVFAVWTFLHTGKKFYIYMNEHETDNVFKETFKMVE